MTTFPYRFRATEAPYAGTTFVYPSQGRVITYRTEAPTSWTETMTFWQPSSAGGFTSINQGFGETASHEMTPGQLAEFEAIPLGDGT